MKKIGLSTYAWYQLPLERMLELLADTGYAAVSLGSRKEHSDYHTATGRQRLSRLLQKQRLELDSVHAPAGIREGRLLDISDPDASVRQHALHETLHAIHAAADCGAPYVVIHPLGTKWRADFDLEARAQVALHSLETLQQVAARYQVTMALENLDPPEQVLFDRIFEEAANLGLVYCFDNGHAFVESDPAWYWERMRANVRTLHLHDNDGHVDTHDAPGTGRFPWHALRDWLQAGRYDGILGLECRFKGTEESDFREWLKQNLTFLRTHLAGEE